MKYHQPNSASHSVDTCAYNYICTSVFCVHMCTFVCVCVHVCVCVYVYMIVYACAYECVCICVHVSLCVCVWHATFGFGIHTKTKQKGHIHHSLHHQPLHQLYMYMCTLHMVRLFAHA